ncbi:protein kinase family protein [Lactococcus lactis]|uniref:protein kinase family protein n=1 Tax=Lactococcus lactis TaxID=1358 RepID=UPI003D2AFFED
MNTSFLLNEITDYFRLMLQKGPGELREEALYPEVVNPKLRFCFAAFQKKFNELLLFYNSKAQLNMHFNADPSRELMELLEKFKDFKFGFEDTDKAFKLVETYHNVLKFIEPTLSPSGGSIIPEEYNLFSILNYDPIIVLDNQLKVNEKTKESFSLLLVNEGSYARVYKYTDTNYDTIFALKRAKADLTSTEVTRFKKEFQLMKSLDSPYILKVYSYNNQKNEFKMEYVKHSLKDYISKNNPHLNASRRKSLCSQLFRALEYIHSKSIFHRDLSLGNILVKVHDDDSCIIKVCDFGYLKEKKSTLTRVDTVFAGSLNDPSLKLIGFDKYNVQHEIYALTQVIFYIMTGKENIEKINQPSIKSFLEFGMNSDLLKRAKTLQELKHKYSATNWET